MATLLKVEINGLPPTVNHLYRSTRGGQRYKTKLVREYQKYVTELLKTEWQGKLSCTSPVELKIIFTTTTRRKWDIDNRVKALQDCLSKAGVIKDDTQIDILHVERVYGQEDTTRLTLNERVQ